jgi:glycosyltransferase involved in cell wall biosynthesis
MKILYLHQHFSTPKGATGIRSYQMARKALQQGHEVTMVCGSYGGGETGLTMPLSRGMRRGCVDGIQVIEFDLAYSNNANFIIRSVLFVRFMLRCVWLVLTEEYDVAFATTTPLTVGLPGIVARWIRRRPFVFEVRDLWPELPRAMGVIRNPIILAALSVLEWASYKSATRLIGLSPGIVEGIARRGIPADRIMLIPNGCDLDIFTTKISPWRPAEFNTQDMLAVFTGTHGIANGLDAVLDAASVLKKRGRTDIKILLVGQGRNKSMLQERAAKDGLDNVFFHDPVDKQKLSQLFAGSDLGLQILANIPSFYYGTSPNKFFDYISAGLPVLTNYPGWVADLITANHCGFAIEPDCPEAFASALETAADERGQLKKSGKNSLNLAKSQFDRDFLAAQWVMWVAQTPAKSPDHTRHV